MPPIPPANSQSMENGLSPGSYVEDPTKLTLKQMKTVWGDSGTQRWSGFFYEEFNSAMRDESRVRIIEEMRRTDGAVKAALNAIKTPILATEWRIEGEDDEIVDFVENSLFKMKRSWKDFLREALAYFDFGHYVFEILWEMQDGKAVIADLAPRIPRSIFRWRMSNGEPGITQIIRTDEFTKAYAEIPLEKLLILTNDKEGDDVTGQSVLRAAYKHYKLKDVLYRIQGIAAERMGVGVPVITMPDGFGPADKQKAQELAANMRANEQGYMVLPSSQWKVEILTPQGRGTQGADMIQTVNHHNSMILMTILASFLNLGQDGTGSLALSKDLSSFFLKHVEDKCQYIAEQITQQVIKPMVKLNFGDDADVPELKFNPLGDIDFTEMSTVLKTLNDAGMIRNDPSFVQYVHKMFKLPEISDDDVATAEDSAEAITQAPEDAKNATTPPASPETNVTRPQNPLTKSGKVGPVGPFNPVAVLPALNPKNGSSKPSTGDQSKVDNTKMEEEKKKDIALLAEQKYEPFRALTMQEKRLSMENLNQKFNDLQGKFDKDFGDATDNATKHITEQTRQKLEMGILISIGVLAADTIEQIRQAIAQAISEGQNYGRGVAVNELNKALPEGVRGGLPIERPPLTTEQADLKAMEVDNLTKGVVGKLEGAAQSIVAKAKNADASNAAIVTAVRDEVQKAADAMKQSISNTIVGQAINRGRMDIFTNYIDSIVKFQRSEVIDGATCEMCLTLDGRVITADDPFANLDIVHSGCRGVWIPITTEDEKEKELPLDPIPKSAMDNFDLIDGRPVVNAFKNLKKALPLGHV